MLSWQARCFSEQRLKETPTVTFFLSNIEIINGIPLWLGIFFSSCKKQDWPKCFNLHSKNSSKRRAKKHYIDVHTYDVERVQAWGPLTRSRHVLAIMEVNFLSPFSCFFKKTFLSLIFAAFLSMSMQNILSILHFLNFKKTNATFFTLYVFWKYETTGNSQNIRVRGLQQIHLFREKMINQQIVNQIFEECVVIYCSRSSFLLAITSWSNILNHFVVRSTFPIKALPCLSFWSLFWSSWGASIIWPQFHRWSHVVWMES